MSLRTATALLLLLAMPPAGALVLTDTLVNVPASGELGCSTPPQYAMGFPDPANNTSGLAPVIVPLAWPAQACDADFVWAADRVVDADEPLHVEMWFQCDGSLIGAGNKATIWDLFLYVYVDGTEVGMVRSELGPDPVGLCSEEPVQVVEDVDIAATKIPVGGVLDVSAIVTYHQPTSSGDHLWVITQDSAHLSFVTAPWLPLAPLPLAGTLRARTDASGTWSYTPSRASSETLLVGFEAVHGTVDVTVTSEGNGSWMASLEQDGARTPIATSRQPPPHTATVAVAEGPASVRIELTNQTGPIRVALVAHAQRPARDETVPPDPAGPGTTSSGPSAPADPASTATTSDKSTPLGAVVPVGAALVALAVARRRLAS